MAKSNALALPNEVTEMARSPGAATPESGRRGSVFLVVHHPDGAETMRLEPDVPVTVGRQEPADLILQRQKVSRRHARFTLQPSGRILVEDLGSTNGTWLEGARVERIELDLGTVISIGDAVLRAKRIEVQQGSTPPTDEDFIAVSPAMKVVLEEASRLAKSPMPVLIYGETGVGKEVITQYVHRMSPRASRKLVSVNCAAIPATLVESTLFGHEKGAFTGAIQKQIGVFEEANGGTVFLDELGELPLSIQASLLRVIETGRFCRVGSPKEITVDVRLLAATHRDLDKQREEGTFRADLYYRLSVLELTIPPLRARAEDIDPLARRFMTRASQGRVVDIEPAALDKLRSYAWPGNVRELRNAIERAVVLAQDDTLRAEDLPARIQAGPSPPSGAVPLPSPSITTSSTKDTPAPSVAELRAQMADYEAQRIAEMLLETGWNRSEAARRLGMPIRTLTHKVKVLGLKKPGT